MGKLSNEITSIYNDYKPAFKNLYRIEIYPVYNSSVSTVKDYISLHATSITFDEESLSLERNPITKNFQISNSEIFKRANKMTITWREDINWTVKKYHESWLSEFYNKENDCFISSSNKTEAGNRYRIFRICLPDEKNEFKKCIQFNWVLPEISPGIELSWGSSSDVISHRISYYVRDWRWITKPNTGRRPIFGLNQIQADKI